MLSIKTELSKVTSGMQFCQSCLVSLQYSTNTSHFLSIDRLQPVSQNKLLKLGEEERIQYNIQYFFALRYLFKENKIAELFLYFEVIVGSHATDT